MRVRVLGFNIAIGGESVDLGMVVEAIRRCGADVVGLQECEGNAPRIAQLLGWAHADERQQVISRWPLVEPHDADGHHLFVFVEPTRVVAIANVHLPSDPYGPYAHRDGATHDEVVELEDRLRMDALAPSLDRWRGLLGSGTPLVVTGDFNTPSHRDWGVHGADHRTASVSWPVPLAMETAGFVDTYRSAHPDRPGLTWTTGFPHPRRDDHELSDRIDYVWCSPSAHVVDSTLVGPSGVADVGVAVDPWPSDHLGVVSTLEIDPVPPPHHVGVLGRRIEHGDTIAVRWASPGGAAVDRLALVREGDPADDAIAWLAPRETEHTGLVRFGTGGLGVGPHDVVLTSAGTELGRVTVHVVSRGALPRLSARRSGDDVEVRWYDAPGRKFDWVGLYRRGDPDLEHGRLALVHTGATVTGRHLFTDVGVAPFTVRLLHDDGFAVLAELDLP